MPKKKLKAEPAIMRYYPEKDYIPESKPFYLYEDKDYKPEAKPFPLYDNETLESKRKGGMTKNLNTKVKKAYLGKAVRQPTETDTEFEIRHEYHTPFKGPQKASLGALIGIGADNLLKKSETARSLTKNLGIGGNLLGSYYDKKADTRDKATGAQQTQQVTAKQKGGMVEIGKGKDYIKDLL